MIKINVHSAVFPSLRQSFQTPESTIDKMLSAIGIPHEFWRNITVFVNGRKTDQEFWSTVRPKSGALVSVSVIPAFDSPHDRKEFLRTATYTLFPILGYMIGGPVGGAFGGLFGAWVAQLIPVPEETIAETSYAVTGIRNEIRKYGSIPIVLGRHRIYPPLGAQLSTEVRGDDLYAAAIFCCGYGPLRMTQFKIGETDIKEYESVLIETRSGFGFDASKPYFVLYPNDVYEEIIDAPLEYAPSWTNDTSRQVRKPIHQNIVEFRTQPGTTKISIDFVFPDGLGVKEDDDWTGARVDVMVRYRLRASSDTDGEGRSTWIYAVPEDAWDILHSVEWSESFLSSMLDSMNAELQRQMELLEAVSGVSREASDFILSMAQLRTMRIQESVRAILTEDTDPLSLSMPAAYTTTENLLTALGNDLRTVSAILDDAIGMLSLVNAIINAIIIILDAIEATIYVNECQRLGFGQYMDSLPLWHQFIISIRQIEWIFGKPENGAFVLTNMALHQGTLRTNCSFQVPSGEYDVQVRRSSPSARIVNQGRNQVWDLLDLVENPDGINESIIDTVRVGTVRSICENVHPLSDRAMSRYACFAVQIKSSESLTGSIEQFNCIAEHPIPWHDGTEWKPRAFRDADGNNVYRNPAWIYCYILRGPFNPDPITDDEYLDLTRIKEWADFCNDNGYYFDAVYDKETTIQKVLQDVCRVGKATPCKRDGKYSVVYDHVHTLPVAIIGDRNAGALSGQKSFIEIPHAIKQRFVDAQNGYQESEYIVYDDGYAETDSGGMLEATNIEEVDGFVGLTDRDHAYKLGRYIIADMKLRPETFVRTMDWENIVFERGDMVEMQSQVTMWGYNSARAVSIDEAIDHSITGICVDEEITFVSGTDYQIKIRGNDNSIVVADIDASSVSYYRPEDGDNVISVQTLFDFVSPISASEGAGISAGCFCVFGEKDLVTTEVIVKEIASNGDLTAKVTLVEHAPAVHSSDTEEIPDFTTRITRPADPHVIQPAKPLIIGWMTDERALTRNPDGSLVSRIVLNVSLPRGDTPTQQLASSYVDAVEVQYRRTVFDPNMATTPWTAMPIFKSSGVSLYAAPCDDASYYDVRVRSITKYGVPSLWETAGRIYVIGKATPPPNVQEVRYSKGIISWEYKNAPLDFKGFLVKVISGTSESWAGATACHDGLLSTNSIDVSSYAWGPKVFFIKAVDVAGNESERAATVSMDLGDPPIENIINEYNLRDLGWPGTKTGCEVVSDGSLRVSLGSKTQFYRNLDSPMYSVDLSGAGSKPPGSDNPFYTTTYQPFVYEFSVIPNSAEDGCQMDVFVDPSWIGTLWKVEYRELDIANFWPEDLSMNLWPADANQPIWPDWQTWKAWTGKVIAQAGKTYQFRILREPGQDAFGVDNLYVRFDIPDIEETIEDYLVSDSGTVRLPITKAYSQIKSVSLTVQSSGSYVSAYTARVLDKDAINGPSVEVYDASGIRTSGIIDARIKGY